MIQCRPGAAHWAYFILFGLLGAIFVAIPWLASPSSQIDPITWLRIMACVPIGMGVWAVWLLRARVVAEDTRLRWRGLGGWKEARWEDISDYYTKPGPKRQPLLVIETPTGKLTLSDDTWSHIAALREYVQQRATHALAREWGESGTREEDPWPRVFTYDRAKILHEYLHLSVLALMLIAGYYYLIVPKISVNLRDLGWSMGLAYIGTSTLIFGLYGLLGLAFLPHVRAAHRRQDQRIIAEPEGLTFEDGVRRIQVAWQDIGEFYVAQLGGLITSSGRYVVVTKNGSFDFTSLLKDARVLRKLIERYAPAAVEAGQQTHASVENLFSSQKEERPGERLFVYRTRTSRALLWMATTITVVAALAPWIGNLRWENAGYAPSSAVPALLSGMATLWAWWRYRTTKIIIDSTGITKRTPFRTESIFWTDVQAYYVGGGDVATFFHIVGSKEHLRIWFGISNKAVLMQEIARRAINSQSKEWTRTGIAKR